MEDGRSRTSKAQSRSTAIEAAGEPEALHFAGLLFRAEFGDVAPLDAVQPDFFVDLGLDQIVAAATKGKDEYDLHPFFWRPPESLEAIGFRHEIVEDLEQPGLRTALLAFATSMQAVRANLARAERHEHPYQKWRWRLDAANRYWSCVKELCHSLEASPIKARGLVEFRAYLAAYVASEIAVRRTSEGLELAAALAAIRYGVVIDGLRIEVRDIPDEPDYGAMVENTFAAFDDAGSRTYDFQLDTSIFVNRVEGDILTLVGRIHAETFKRLEAYSAPDPDFVDAAISQFDREIQFFVAFLDHIDRLRQMGLEFCLPLVSAASDVIAGEAVFDLALADKLSTKGGRPVCNDFRLKSPQRMIVVTGPNQGGKTTFARMVGQIHYLAKLGLPAPGSAVRVTMQDRLFTHFERVEHMASLRGKLQDDLVRIHAILDQAGPRSLIIINEIFASTTLGDAIWLSQKVAERVLAMGCLCVWVTFIDELASLSDAVVSMSSMVEPDDPAVRTFKILQRPPTGMAYAMSLAKKHRVDHSAVMERLA